MSSQPSSIADACQNISHFDHAIIAVQSNQFANSIRQAADAQQTLELCRAFNEAATGHATIGSAILAHSLALAQLLVPTNEDGEEDVPDADPHLAYHIAINLMHHSIDVVMEEVLEQRAQKRKE